MLFSMVRNRKGSTDPQLKIVRVRAASDVAANTGLLGTIPWYAAYVIEVYYSDGSIDLIRNSDLPPFCSKHSWMAEKYALEQLIEELQRRGLDPSSIWCDNKKTVSHMKRQYPKIEWIKGKSIFPLHDLADTLAKQSLDGVHVNSPEHWDALNSHRYPYCGPYDYCPDKGGPIAYWHHNGQYSFVKRKCHKALDTSTSDERLKELELKRRSLKGDDRATAQLFRLEIMRGTFDQNSEFNWSTDASDALKYEVRRALSRIPTVGTGAAKQDLSKLDPELLEMLVPDDRSAWAKLDTGLSVTEICGKANVNRPICWSVFSVIRYRYRKDLGKECDQALWAYQNLHRISLANRYRLHRKLGLKPKHQVIHDSVVQAVLINAGMKARKIPHALNTCKQLGLLSQNDLGEWEIANSVEATRKHLKALPKNPADLGCDEYENSYGYQSRQYKKLRTVANRDQQYALAAYSSAALITINFFVATDGKSTSPFPRNPAELMRIIPYLVVLSCQTEAFERKNLQLGIVGIAKYSGGISFDGVYGSLKVYTDIINRSQLLARIPCKDAYKLRANSDFPVWVDGSSIDFGPGGRKYTDVYRILTNRYESQLFQMAGSKQPNPAATLIKEQVFGCGFGELLKRHSEWINAKDGLGSYHHHKSMPSNVRTTMAWKEFNRIRSLKQSKGRQPEDQNTLAGPSGSAVTPTVGPLPSMANRSRGKTFKQDQDRFAASSNASKDVHDSNQLTHSTQPIRERMKPTEPRFRRTRKRDSSRPFAWKDVVTEDTLWMHSKGKLAQPIGFGGQTGSMDRGNRVSSKGLAQMSLDQSSNGVGVLAVEVESNQVNS